jgi:hypothetical protein
LQSDFSAELLKSRKAWNDIYQALRVNNFHPRLLYLAKLSFKIDGEIKTYQDKYRLKQFMTSKPALQRILKGILHTDEEER